MLTSKVLQKKDKKRVYVSHSSECKYRRLRQNEKKGEKIESFFSL